MRLISLALVLFIFSTFFVGCKADEETKKQVTELTTKLNDASKRVDSLEADAKKSAHEMELLRDTVTKLGHATVELQKAREETAAKRNLKTAGAMKGKKSIAPVKTKPKVALKKVRH